MKYKILLLVFLPVLVLSQNWSIKDLQKKINIDSNAGYEITFPGLDTEVSLEVEATDKPTVDNPKHKIWIGFMSSNNRKDFIQLKDIRIDSEFLYMSLLVIIDYKEYPLEYYVPTSSIRCIFIHHNENKVLIVAK